MTTLYSLLFFFVLGIAAGYRLFPAVAKWRSKRRQKTFRPLLLRRYRLNQSGSDRL